MYFSICCDFFSTASVPRVGRALDRLWQVPINPILDAFDVGYSIGIYRCSLCFLKPKTSGAHFCKREVKLRELLACITALSALGNSLWSPVEPSKPTDQFSEHPAGRFHKCVITLSIQVTGHPAFASNKTDHGK